MDSSDIRKGIQSRWEEYLSTHANLFTSDSLDGASPPSVFVGSYGYPKVSVGPMDHLCMVIQLYLTVRNFGLEKV